MHEMLQQNTNGAAACLKCERGNMVGRVSIAGVTLVDCNMSGSHTCEMAKGVTMLN
jgi:hypothetical protein